ncbi:MAG: hypothetical protein ACRDTT_21025 [Pseudonocardiaceae bacterium]
MVIIGLISLGRLEFLFGESGVLRFGISATSVLGAGFWFILIGMLAAGIGGLMMLQSAERIGGPVGGRKME